jgi:hypothetical protein
MSKPVVVTIPHSLGKDEAARRLKAGLAKATSTLPMIALDEEVWAGDRMTFRLNAMGQQAAGTVDVADKDVRIEVTLPWLLQRFAEMIQGGIAQKGQILLEKK